MKYRHIQTGVIVEAVQCTTDRKQIIEGVHDWDPREKRPRDFSVGYIIDCNGRRWHVRPQDWVVKGEHGFSKWTRELFATTFERMEDSQGWIPASVEPEETEMYLVVQQKPGHHFRWVRLFIWGEGWQDIKEDRYGPITHWMKLPPFPAEVQL